MPAEGDAVMDDANDFVVPYPCFLAAGDADELVVINTGDERCIVLLTDEHLAEQFFADRATGESRVQVSVHMCERRGVLLNSLRRFEPQLSSDGVFHLAIDPSVGRRFAVTTILEFIDHVEKSKE
jgi:hypothetical protein